MNKFLLAAFIGLMFQTDAFAWKVTRAAGSNAMDVTCDNGNTYRCSKDFSCNENDVNCRNEIYNAAAECCKGKGSSLAKIPSRIKLFGGGEISTAGQPGLKLGTGVSKQKNLK